MKKESYFYCIMVGLGLGKTCYSNGLVFVDDGTPVQQVFDYIIKTVADSRNYNTDDVIMLAFNRV